MTARSVIPDLATTPHTFTECPDRGECKIISTEGFVTGHWCKYQKPLIEKYCYCEGAICHGCCPRGFK